MQGPQEQNRIDLADVAAEPVEASVDAEQEVVGKDEPDVGGTVPPDQSQSAHDD